MLAAEVDLLSFCFHSAQRKLSRQIDPCYQLRQDHRLINCFIQNYLNVHRLILTDQPEQSNFNRQ